METQNKQKSIELRLWQMNYRDGLFNMFFGSLLMTTGTDQLFTHLELHEPIYIRFGILIWITLFLLVKRFVSMPRMGKAKYRPERRKKRVKAILIAIAAQVFTALILFLGIKKLLPEGEHSHMVSLIIEFLFFVIVFSSIGYFTDNKWFYFIGAVMVLAWPVNLMLQPWLHSRLPGIILQLAAGLFLFLVGLMHFISFLREYPKPGNSITYENE